MTYYIKGGSRYNEANPTVWVALNLAGFADSKYLDANWKQIDYESIIDNQDPFWLFGSTSGGAKEAEFGLYNDYRIKLDATGIYGWNGSGWTDLLAAGGATNLGDLSDVVINSPADNEVLAWDDGTSKWINQTPIGGSGGVTVASSFPGSPDDGDLVYLTTDEALYMWSDDAEAWVHIAGGAGGGGGGEDRNVDGGRADSIYLPSQVIDGGTA